MADASNIEWTDATFNPWRGCTKVSLGCRNCYAETLSAPRTDDLYDRDDVDPGPERSKSYDLGIRYQTDTVMAAASLWKSDFSNRIERVLDEAAGIAFSQNVGDVDLNGFDFVLGVLRKIFHYDRAKARKLTLEAHEKGRSIVWSGQLEHAELKADQIRSCGPDPIMKAHGALALKVTVEPLPG